MENGLLPDQLYAKWEIPADTMEVALTLLEDMANDLEGHYYYGPEGLYIVDFGELKQLYSYPVLQLCFYRAGALSSGPVLLTYDPMAPVYSADGSLAGDRIVEIRETEAVVWLDNASLYDLQIDSMNTVDGMISFEHKVKSENGYNSYFYWVLDDGVLCSDYQAAAPKEDPDYSFFHPTAYKEKHIQEEIERLDALGIGLRGK